MESTAQDKKTFKISKKRKISLRDNDGKTVVKPEYFDGMTNWLILQKTLEKVKERVPEKSQKRKSLSRPYKHLLTSNSERKKKKWGKKMGSNNTQLNSKNKNESGFVSGSDLSPVSTGAKLKQNSVTSHANYECHNDENDLNQVTKVVSMDCEMVGTGPDGKDSILARVSIVNMYGQCIFDKFVKPKEKVTDFRTPISGIRPSDLKKGSDLFEVQKDVLDLIKDRKVVGHDLKHDFAVLYISHPRSLIRDTSKYKPFREISGGKTPSLKKLTSSILGCNIQGGEHSSIEDAQAAMLLYLRHKKDWERQIKAARKKKPSK